MQKLIFYLYLPECQALLEYNLRLCVSIQQRLFWRRRRKLLYFINQSILPSKRSTQILTYTNSIYKCSTDPVQPGLFYKFICNLIFKGIPKKKTKVFLIIKPYEYFKINGSTIFLLLLNLDLSFLFQFCKQTQRINFESFWESNRRASGCQF